MLAVLALGLLLTGRRVFANVLPVQRIRVDGSGDGHYHASRTGHSHEGLDLLVEPGAPVHSPVDGTVARIANVYQDSTRYKGVVIESAVHEVKLFYVVPAVHAGDYVKAGDVVGYAQAISDRYGGGMLDHIHVEVRTLPGMQTVDPATLLVLSA